MPPLCYVGRIEIQFLARVHTIQRGGLQSDYSTHFPRSADGYPPLDDSPSLIERRKQHVARRHRQYPRNSVSLDQKKAIVRSGQQANNMAPQSMASTFQSIRTFFCGAQVRHDASSRMTLAHYHGLVWALLTQLAGRITGDARSRMYSAMVSCCMYLYDQGAQIRPALKKMAVVNT